MTLGTLSKMKVKLNEAGEAEYFMRLSSAEVPMAKYFGQTLRLEFTGNIYCAHCGEPTNKSFSQGYCFRHAKSLAACDLCIVRPETCHYYAGTCREPKWGEENCMISHTVYLANSSDLKVGITRSHQTTTRWIDQGASQAIPICTVNRRLDAGLVETALKAHISDKTNWRALLKGDAEPIDLLSKREELIQFLPEDIEYQLDTESQVTEIKYNVANYPKKIVSHNFDKDPVVEGILLGIKGQYLILDTGVINIRKFTSYEVEMNDCDEVSVALPDLKSDSFLSRDESQNYYFDMGKLAKLPRVGPYGTW